MTFCSLLSELVLCIEGIQIWIFFTKGWRFYNWRVWGHIPPEKYLSGGFWHKLAAKGKKLEGGDPKFGVRYLRAPPSV